jgi:hypothetical protein
MLKFVSEGQFLFDNLDTMLFIICVCPIQSSGSCCIKAKKMSE